MRYHNNIMQDIKQLCTMPTGIHHPSCCPSCGHSFMCGGTAITNLDQPSLITRHTLSNSSNVSVNVPSGTTSLNNNYYNTQPTQPPQPTLPPAPYLVPFPPARRLINDCDVAVSNVSKIGEVGEGIQTMQNIQAMQTELNIPQTKRRKVATEEVRKYFCPVEDCHYTSDYSSNVHRHVLTHTGERPFCCMYEGCDSTFTQQSALKAHQCIHTGVKPHKCQYDGCGSSFAAAKDLRIHLRKHTGEKPCACPFIGCDGKYGDPSALRKHIRRKHNGEGLDT